jgi:TonB family protein
VLLFAAAALGPPPPLSPHILTVPLHIPLQAPRIRQEESGGGQGMPEPASKGVLPKRQPRMFLPPMVAVNEQPKLVLAVGLMDAPETEATVGEIGNPLGLIGRQSGGPGKFGGLGEGENGGIGGGRDSGFSGREVAQPKLTRTPQVIYQEEPQYSEPARKAHAQGYVRLRMEVGLDGRPFNIRVVQPMGMGLDESAIEAVKHWRFRPALIGDRPVVAPALVEVGFHLL